MFSITKAYESLTKELFPDDVITYYNGISGVALVSGECYLSIYVVSENNDSTWAFVMEYGRNESYLAYKALENIEKHRMPTVVNCIKSEEPYKACEPIELSEAYSDGELPF